MKTPSRQLIFLMQLAKSDKPENYNVFDLVNESLGNLFCQNMPKMAILYHCVDAIEEAKTFPELRIKPCNHADLTMEILKAGIFPFGSRDLPLTSSEVIESMCKKILEILQLTSVSKWRERGIWVDHHSTLEEIFQVWVNHDER